MPNFSYQIHVPNYFVFLIYTYKFERYAATTLGSIIDHSNWPRIWCGATTNKSVCFTACFCFKMNSNIRSQSNWPRHLCGWCTCAIILERCTFESQTGSTWPLLTRLAFLEIICLAFPISYTKGMWLTAILKILLP